MSPHESLALNPKRGLLAAVLGNPSTYPGLVSIYDAHADCRHPVLQSTALVARLGHESGFAPDGKTFYATGTAVDAITAIDVTDPKHPHPIWQGNIRAHGMSISSNGNRAYVADPNGGDMLILDTSRDPGSGLESAGPRGQPADMGLRIDPPERHPVHGPRQALRPRVRRVHGGDPRPERRSGRGGSGTHHRYLRRAAAPGRVEPAPAGQPAGRPPTPRPATREPGAPCRDTRRTTATSRALSTRRSWPARSSPRGCGSSTSAASTRRRRSRTTWPPPRRRSRTASRPAPSRCRSRRWCLTRREIWFSDGTSGFYAVRIAKAVWPS